MIAFLTSSAFSWEGEVSAKAPRRERRGDTVIVLFFSKVISRNVAKFKLFSRSCVSI